MTHPILDGIRSLRRKLVRRTWAAGGVRVLAAILAVVCVLGAIDYFVRIADPGVRVIMTAAVVLVFVGACVRWILRPLFGAPSEVVLARRVMEQDSRFGEELPSAVEFLRQSEDDPTAGSASLRRAVVIQATSEAEGLVWEGLARRLPGDTLRRAAMVATLPLLLLAALTVWRPQLVAVGIARLASPLGAIDWPRAHELRFVQAPERLPSGETFEVELEDRQGRLPDVVWIHYRYLRDGQEVLQREAMQRYGDRMVARREMVTQPFAYRAVGGDDDRMPWRRLEVVEPPRLRSLELTLHPPAYSGMRPLASDRHIRALPGTQIELSAEVSHPVVGAGVVDENGHGVAAAISDDGLSIHIPQGEWTAEVTARWTLQLEDDEGLVGGEDDRISLHVSPDPPPSVVLEQPRVDQYVTPEAVLDLTVAAKDNLAIRNLAITYLRSDQTEQDRQRIELFRGPGAPPRLTADSLAAIEADRREVDYSWRLAPLGLLPGTFLAVHAEASDYRGEIGQTPLARNVYIVSLADLEARLAEQQDVLLGEMERALQLEREARADVGGVQVQLEQVGTLNQRELDTLQAVEINQRHITDLLADREEGIPSRIDALRADLAANRIENPDIHRRLNELDAELKRLATDHLPIIQQELTFALKTAGSTNAADRERLTGALRAASEHQDAVIDALAVILGDFSRWSDYRRFARDVAQLRADQQRVAQMTRDDIGLDQLQVDPSRLSPQARASRERVAQRQLELARRLETLQQQMGHAIEELVDADPLASTTLTDAVDAARRHAIDRRMRESADYLGRNQIARSLDAQAHVDEALREVLGILRNTREGELRRLVSKLREAEEDLAAMREQAAGLRGKAEAATGESNEVEKRRQLERLKREERELQETIERMARRLMRLTADRAARSAGRAAGQLGEGGGQGESAGGRVRAAERDLEQAQAELAEARRQAEADLAAEQLADILTTIQSLTDRQHRIVTETERLDEARAARGEWTIGQLQSLASLAEEQKLLGEESLASAAKFAGLGVVRTALEMAAEEMRGVAERLATRDTGELTQNAARAAHKRLQMVLAALGESPQEGGEESGGEGGANGGGQGGGQGGDDEGNTIELAELRLLKFMQADLQQRTQAAEAELAAGESERTVANRRFTRLADEQGQMAALIQQLLDATAGSSIEVDAELPSLEDALEQDDPLPEIEF